MPRTIPAAMLWAMRHAPQSEFVHLLELDLSQGTVYYTTGASDVTWSGHAWKALGGDATFDKAGEAADVAGGSGIQITLAAVDRTALAAIQGSYLVGRTATVYLAHLSPSSRQPVSDPVLLFRGLMNGGVQWTESRGDGSAPGRATLTLTCEPRVAGLARVGGLQMATAAQQQRFPGDLFFQYVGAAAAQPTVWKK